jgi:hypothetical protein
MKCNGTFKPLMIMVAGLTLTVMGGCTNVKKENIAATKAQPVKIEGSVVDKNGSAMYGTERQYTRDIYLGRLSQGAQFILVDTSVGVGNHNIPIIKVKVLDDSGYGKHLSGRIGWINLKDTDIVKYYDPETKSIVP